VDKVLSGLLLDLSESSLHGGKRLRVLTPNFFNRVLRCNDKFDGSNVLAALLDLSDEWEEVCPMLELAGEVPVEDVHVVEDDDFLFLVPVPPFVEGLEVRIRVGTVDACGLSAARCAMDPKSTYSKELLRPDHVVLPDGLERVIVAESKLGIDILDVA